MASINTLHSVFFHEIGHYIARELNLRLFNKGLGVAQIRLRVVTNKEGRLDYQGETIAAKPKGYRSTDRIKDLPEYIAVLLYGCLFQVLYDCQKNHTIDFTTCFNLKPNNQGFYDCKAYSSLNGYCTHNNRMEIVEYTGNEYFKKLKNKRHFKNLFEIDPMEFLTENKSYLEADLGRLNQRLTVFIESHMEEYLAYIQRIKDSLE